MLKWVFTCFVCMLWLEYMCVGVWLTTLTSCEMETSNSTVTGSETFSTGLMNWLYLLNSFLNRRSSAFDEKQSEETERGQRQRGEGTERVAIEWMSECWFKKKKRRLKDKLETVCAMPRKSALLLCFKYALFFSLTWLYAFYVCYF